MKCLALKPLRNACSFGGREVEVQIAEGAAMVKPLEDGSTGTSRDMLEGDLMDIFETENARAEKLSPGVVGTALCNQLQLQLDLKARWHAAHVRKCRVIAEMLTERAVLEGALADDRALSGAKNPLLKYALGHSGGAVGRLFNRQKRRRAC